MSLLAEYDDLLYYTAMLTSGLEEEFRIFAESQLNCVRKWKKLDAKVKELQARTTNLESERGHLKEEIKHLKNLLHDEELTKRKTEMEKKYLQRVIAAVRDVVLSDDVKEDQIKAKLVFLNSTNVSSPGHLETIEESNSCLFSLSGTDQMNDHLENCVSLKRSTRRSEGGSEFEARIPPKEDKLNEAEFFENEVNKKEGHQCNSKLTSTSSDASTVSGKCNKVDSVQFRFNDYDTSSILKSTSVSSQASVKHFSKNHELVSKKVIKSVKCLACRHDIGYLKQSLKCASCGIICHPECKTMCPVFCFPITNVPTKGTGGGIADYTSSSSPMIPPLIVYCVREIEFRGIKEIGLYRISASEQDVKNLIDKFASRHVPNLNDVNIHTLCVAVKEFLRSLDEPLITYKLRRAFVDAASLEDTVESSYNLLRLVNHLPQPNRDTLSFLILHWKTIAESPPCKMDIENLSKVLGPVVVGHSTLAPAGGNRDEETAKQHQVMKQLFSISTVSWHSKMNVEMFHGIEETPERLSPPKGSLLGPIYTSVQKRKSFSLRKRPFSPRNSECNTLRKMYFASPLIEETTPNK